MTCRGGHSGLEPFQPPWIDRRRAPPSQVWAAAWPLEDGLLLRVPPAWVVGPVISDSLSFRFSPQECDNLELREAKRKLKLTNSTFVTITCRSQRNVVALRRKTRLRMSFRTRRLVRHSWSCRLRDCSVDTRHSRCTPPGTAQTVRSEAQNSAREQHTNGTCKKHTRTPTTTTLTVDEAGGF